MRSSGTRRGTSFSTPPSAMAPAGPSRRTRTPSCQSTTMWTMSVSARPRESLDVSIRRLSASCAVPALLQATSLLAQTWSLHDVKAPRREGWRTRRSSGPGEAALAPPGKSCCEGADRLFHLLRSPHGAICTIALSARLGDSRVLYYPSTTVSARRATRAARKVVVAEC